MEVVVSNNISKDGGDQEGVLRRSTITLDNHDEMSVIALGAGCEVGRSCIVVEYRNKVVMFDCGIHPGHSGIGALPVFDAVNVRQIDLCLVTHFHLDHCGAVPYFVSKTPFNGVVVMTEPTKAIAKLLWTDYAAMAARSAVTPQSAAQLDTDYNSNNPDGVLFDTADIDKAMSLIKSIDFRQTLDFKELGIRVSCFAAGHVLGACMFCVEIAGVRILYTGDFSREADRHVPMAEIPNLSSVHVLICESTYGIRVHEARFEREQRFLDSVLRIVRRWGKCLMPVFALGRAQELLLILEEYWEAHPDVQSIPIWYCSPMSSRGMPVFRTFISVCGDYVKKIADRGIDPFAFHFIKNARTMDDMKHDVFAEGQPCIVMAAPGMLQSGTSRALFELWCQDPRNGIILTGYSVRGTIADELKRNPHSLQFQRDGPSVQIQCSTEMISFSAHSDFDQTFKFIEAVKPQVVILVHGERGEINRLKDKLKGLCPHLAVFAPEILQRFFLRFPRRFEAKAVGRLAQRVAANAAVIKDANATTEKKNARPHPSVLLLNSTNATPLLVAPEDLDAHVPTASLLQTRYIECHDSSIELLFRRLEHLFEGLVLFGTSRLRVEERINLTLFPEAQRLEMSWRSDPLSDLISDAVACVLIDTAVSTGAQNRAVPENQQQLVPSESQLLNVVLVTLRQFFEHVEVHRNETLVHLTITVLRNAATQSTAVVYVDMTDRQVSGKDSVAVDKVRRILRRIEHPLLPIPCFSSTL